MKNEKNEMVEMKERLQEALTIRKKKPVDLAKDLGIPKSAISQYLSGKTKDMDSKRLYKVCVYLNVSESWLMGYDVPMERTQPQKNNDIMSDIIVRMRTDEVFFEAVKAINNLDSDEVKGVTQMLNAFQK